MRNPGNAGIGTIIRDCSSSISLGQQAIAEQLALRAGLREALRFNLRDIWLEGDSKCVISGPLLIVSCLGT